MNLAMLRVFAILITVNALNGLAGFLLQATMKGFDEGESFAGIAPMILASIIAALVGIIVFVKKSAKLLMVFSIIAIIMNIVGAIMYTHWCLGLQISLSVGFLLRGLADHFINMMMVVYVTSLFMGQMKTLEGSRVNLGLLRFCAVVFLVDGFSFLVLGHDHSVSVVVMMTASIVAGIVALAKNNTLVLKAFAVCSLAWLLWTHFEFIRTNMFGAYYVANAIVGVVFSAHLVVCITTFFIDAEESKLFLQKLKTLFFKWKNLT